MSEELKPCPFCGGEVKIEDISDEDGPYFMIACSNKACGAAASFGDKSETEEGATEAWNTRASSATVNQYGNNCCALNCGTLNITL